MNFQMSRDDVEKLLDLKVSRGRMTPERKIELMQEYDARVQMMNGQGDPNQMGYQSQMGYQNQQGFQGQQVYQGQQGYPNQQGYAAYNAGPQGVYNQPYNQGYDQSYQQQNLNQNVYGSAAAIPPGYRTQSILNGPQMIITFIFGIVLVVAAKMNIGWLTGAATGAIFAFVAAILLKYEMKKEKKHVAFPALFLIIGVILIMMSLFSLLANDGMKASVSAYSDVIMLAVFVLVGLGMIIVPLINRSRLKKVCTQPVQAKCIELLNPRHGNSFPRKRAPLYEFYYNGETRRLMNGVYSSKGYPQIGEVREIFIDPTYLDEYYDPKSSAANLIFTCILGTFFMGMGILCFVLIYFN